MSLGILNFIPICFIKQINRKANAKSKETLKGESAFAEQQRKVSHQTTQCSTLPGKQNTEISTNEQKTLKEENQLQYSNQFMNVPQLQNGESPNKAFNNRPKPQYVKERKDHQSLEIKMRFKTEAKQDKPKEKKSSKKYTSFLPLVSSNPLPQLQQKTRERNIKLKELYQKKSKLYKKLQSINKKLINAKLESYVQLSNVSALEQNNIVNAQAKLKSKSYSNSRNNHYMYGAQTKNLFEYKKKRDISPQSMISPQKNREVICFIKKMHEESVKRDLNRYNRSQKAIENQLNHVCLECTRSKCQAEAIDRILKDSRLI